MKLVRPSEKYKESFKSALEEYVNEGLKNEGDPHNVNLSIRKLRARAEKNNQVNNKVPATIYWLIEKGVFIGRVSVRHCLSKKLKKTGGHIGYSIRPSKRNNGYGSSILKLALSKAKKIGIKKAMLTCNKKNIGSQKIIERNGGIFRDQIKTEKSIVNRYWLFIN